MFEVSSNPWRMEFHIYILFSENINKYYVGFSSNLEQRVEYHNSDQNSIWTKRGQPWRLEFKQLFETRSEAMAAEKFVKNKKSKKFIEKTIQNGAIDFG